jgi:hypothetical protein
MNTNYMSACKQFGEKEVSTALYFAKRGRDLMAYNGIMVKGFARTEETGLWSYDCERTGLRAFVATNGAFRGVSK